MSRLFNGTVQVNPVHNTCREVPGDEVSSERLSRLSRKLGPRFTHSSLSSQPDKIVRLTIKYPVLRCNRANAHIYITMLFTSGGPRKRSGQKSFQPPVCFHVPISVGAQATTKFAVAVLA